MAPLNNKERTLNKMKKHRGLGPGAMRQLYQNGLARQGWSWHWQSFSNINVTEGSALCLRFLAVSH